VYSTNVLEVLAARIDVSPEELEMLSGALDSTELQRARSLPEATKREFVATRAILRTLLGERLEVPAAEVMLRKSENGKLSAVSGDVLFNVAHSKGLAVFAFTHNLQVGVDVELLRPLADLGGVVELTLAPSEAADLQSVPAGDRAAAFFACWTRKEAYLKASGNGLGSPRDVAVTLRPGAPERLVSVQGAPLEPERWELMSFEPRPGYVGAVAVERAT
jgi:4'-phosphopantetheinyl transferase